MTEGNIEKDRMKDISHTNPYDSEFKYRLFARGYEKDF